MVRQVHMISIQSGNHEGPGKSCSGKEELAKVSLQTRMEAINVMSILSNVFMDVRTKSTHLQINHLTQDFGMQTVHEAPKYPGDLMETGLCIIGISPLLSVG